MAHGDIREIMLGTDPQVRVLIHQDGSNLVMQIASLDPDATDIDALFFNFTNDDVIPGLQMWPAVNTLPLTGFEAQPNALDTVSNGAQISDQFDARAEFGQQADSTTGDVDSAGITFWIEADIDLDIDSIDASNMTAVINSDDGNGQELTVGGSGDLGGGNSGGGGSTTTETVTVFDEDFSERDCNLNDDYDHLVAGSTDWDAYGGTLRTDGNDDGSLTLQSFTSDGPVTLSFSIEADNAHAFEESGRYADSLEVQVNVDGQGWVTLDRFVVDESTDTFTGSMTGQSFGEHAATLTYSGGALDTIGTDQDVQFRFVSDISACNEIIKIDDLVVTATETTVIDGGNTGDDTVLGDDILVNGALESSVGDNTWTYRGDVDGWTNANSYAGIETWGDGFLGVDAQDGRSFIELDTTSSSTLDSVYQDVQTESGQTYQLDFSAAQRGVDSESVEVYWNGQLIDTVSPDGANSWEEFSFEVTGTGGQDRLEFRELASENDCMGPLLDAVSLRPIETSDGNTGGGTETVTITTETEVLGEDFSSSHNNDISGYTRWDVENGELNTDGCDDGSIWFHQVDVDGPATISFDARTPNAENFENGGYWGDQLDVYALVDGSNWVHLDTYTVNNSGTALVGNQSGQTIEAQSQTISYSGGELETANTVQLYMHSQITAGNEDIYFDNLSITETSDITIEVPMGTDDPEAWWAENGDQNDADSADDADPMWV
ncbi:MAG: DUF642 domain-containing protein [Pelagimonas sp.]|jgi:hypothetical protein|nr:DUF642 domain-containing protein [Pelagimonas sp.]